MKTDFKLWERATLEQFARQVADEHLALTKRIAATAWHPVSTLPVADRIVLLFDATLLDEPVWPGYHDGDRWLYADGHHAKPMQWAPMPAGPQLACTAPVRGQVIEIPEGAVMFANPGHDYGGNAALDCPHCGGSGHKDDVVAASQLPVDVVMMRVQEFAATWSLIGHPSFKNGSMLDRANELKRAIRDMLTGENCND